MVKKAKKAKKVAKKSKRGPAKRKRNASVPMQTVVQFVRMLIEEGHDDEFEAHASAAGAVVTVSRGDVDVVKKFLDQNRHLRGARMAAAVRDPCPGNPFEC